MTPQPGKQTIAMHLFPNISTNKSSQAMKFCQLIVYNMRDIFFDKSYPEYGSKAIPRLFPERSKLSISLDQ